MECVILSTSRWKQVRISHSGSGVRRPFESSALTPNSPTSVRLDHLALFLSDTPCISLNQKASNFLSILYTTQIRISLQFILNFLEKIFGGTAVPPKKLS